MESPKIPPIASPLTDKTTGQTQVIWWRFWRQIQDGLAAVTAGLAALVAHAITSLTGDVTATGPGAAVATLAASGVTPGIYGDATDIPVITVDAKGRITNAVNVLTGALTVLTGITSLTGDVTTTGSGAAAAGLATGILKNTTATGAPSIAAAADVNAALGYTPTSPAALAAALAAFTGSANVVTLGTITTGVWSGTALVLAKIPTIPSTQTSGFATVATSASAADLSAGTLLAARMPALTGDATSTVGTVATVVGKINGVSLAGLATGLVKNTTGTGAPSIAIAADITVLIQTTGTFTPALLFGGAAVGMTTSAAVGAYTKTGNLVAVVIAVILTAKGSSTGVATITGLPFAVGAGAASWGGTFGVLDGMTGLVNPIVRVSGLTTTVLLSDGGTGTMSQLTHANFTNASNLQFSISYYV
jgi:hypothetical protein